MCKSSDKRYTLPMKNAEASVRMGGLSGNAPDAEQCQRVLRGEVTTAGACCGVFSKPAER